MEHKFQQLPGVFKVSLEHGQDPEEIVPVLRNAACLARTSALQKLLVVSGFDDPTTPGALSEAIEEIHALDQGPPFRIAFVAYTLPQYSIYHFAEHYASKFGIACKVLVSVRDAMDWLGERERAHAPLQAPLQALREMR